jgi:2-keto-4-pentenoate hydratase/2-oxohepta-3-ene-1,7-dioic acid hydratase in catechol pathway
VSDRFFEVSSLPNPILFTLKKNGEVVQEGNSAMMLFDFDAIIEEVSKVFTLKIGDLLFTGTPAGVGKVQAGDVLEGFLFNEQVFSLRVV